LQWGVRWFLIGGSDVLPDLPLVIGPLAGFPHLADIHADLGISGLRRLPAQE
jgi:hypothetical protein